MAAVRHYIDAFNREGMAAAFAVRGSILDGMARHVGHGSTAHYVVVPPAMTFTARESRRRAPSSPVALRKLAEGWRIAASAWAKGKQ